MPRFHPNIVRINTLYANTYLVKNGNNSILVDTGLDPSGMTVLQGIAGEGLKPSDIRLIILTHPHFDHCRGAKAIREATGAEVMVHYDDSACFPKGYGRLPKGVTIPLEAWVSAGRLFMPWLSHFPPVMPDIIVEKELGLASFGVEGRVLHTPGHTKGSLTVVIDGTHAICGDLAVGRKFKPVFPPFADDPAELVRSWKMLADQGIEFLYPGHGHRIEIDRLIQEYGRRSKKYGI